MSATANPQSVQPSRHLTIADVVDFRSTLHTQLAQGAPVVLDLSAVEQIDSAGLQLLVAAVRTGRVTIGAMNETVAQAVRQVGLQSALPTL